MIVKFKYYIKYCVIYRFVIRKIRIPITIGTQELQM